MIGRDLEDWKGVEHLRWYHPTNTSEGENVMLYLKYFPITIRRKTNPNFNDLNSCYAQENVGTNFI